MEGFFNNQNFGGDMPRNLFNTMFGLGGQSGQRPQQQQQQQQNQQQGQRQQQNQQPNQRQQPSQQQARPEPPKKDKEKKKAPAPNSKEAEVKAAENNPNSGHYYKKIGNDFFKSGAYDKAIENYNIAIQMNDTESVFFSNRSRCHKLLGDFKKAYEDAVLAVELDDKNIKGHLLTGQTLAELGKTEEGTAKLELAIKRMTKALTLCAGQGFQVYERDLQKNILRVKKVMWLKNAERKKAELIETYNYLIGLIKNDYSLYENAREKKIDEVKELLGDPLKPQKFEIPDYLCCKITYELMEDPVTTQAGLTYERAYLEEHLKKNGLFDPVTRIPISSDYIYPNLNLKQAIDIFMEKNPWAFEHIPSETYQDVKF